MDSHLYKSEETRIGLIAILAALLIAANEVTQGGIQGLVSTYAYWGVRILIESTLFVATLYALERLFPKSPRHPLIYASAIIISLLPFTLAITSLDLIVGLPELGLNEALNTPTNRWQAFGLELLYLFDNHLVLCLLLLLPRFFSSVESDLTNRSDHQTIKDFPTPLFHETIEPPLQGHICRIEAQEHYIRITTSEEKRMVLYRFSDAVREMPDMLGMQVHRSHWVADSAIKELLKEGQKLQLRLIDEEIVPVSRSFQAQVEQRFAKLPSNSTKA